jgi:hypothetical protein
MKRAANADSASPPSYDGMGKVMAETSEKIVVDNETEVTPESRFHQELRPIP